MRTATPTRMSIVAFAVVLTGVQMVRADNLPLPPGEARTPETRTLSEDETACSLERDWLFQAMAEPLLSRSAKEITWAHELAERLSCDRPVPDLTAELQQLQTLEQRLVELLHRPNTINAVERAKAKPSWIWYPEGRPVEDAPAETRFFRCRFQLPAESYSAMLRIAADDACEVFVNGSRVGSHETWQQTAVFSVGPLLKRGVNLLAVRAENRPAPTKNPAGLIAHLAVSLTDGKQVIVVSDDAWRAKKEMLLGWEGSAFDDSTWKRATVTATFGGGPWGKIAGLDKADMQDDPVAAYADTDPDAKELYFSVRRVKRTILFKNPVLDFSQLLFIDKTHRHSGPPVSIVQEEGVKRILSEVPVEADGSVYFEAPAGRALYFQLLDADRRCLQTMRSFTGLMPGEQRGCVGCHESHSTTPVPTSGLALGRPPTKLRPPPWGTKSISYERFAQPVLDRYCIKCHAGTAEASAEPNLALRPGHSVFKEPYLTLVGSAGWGNPVAGGGPGYGIANAIPVESSYGQNDTGALSTLPPMQYLSYKSRLIELAASGKHYKVKADPESLHRLIAWVDACCPFMGDEELRELGDPDFPGIDRLPIRPRVATAPIVERP